MIGLQYAFICLVFGTTFLAIKTGIGSGLPPLFFAFSRFFFASILLLGFLLARREMWPRNFTMYWKIFVVGILMTAIPFAVLFWSEARISSGSAAIMTATSPIFIGMFTRMKKWQWFGTGIGLLGIYLIFFPDIHTGEGFLNEITPKAGIIISEFFFSIGAIMSKRLMDNGVSSKMLNGLQMFFASLVLFLLSVVFEKQVNVQLNWQAYASLLYLVLIASLFASTIYYRLIEKTNPLFPTTWTYISPVIAILFGAVFLHEQLNLLSSIGSIFVLSGIVLVNLPTLQQLVVKQRLNSGS